ncbi:MAG: hypothetical protein WC003_17475 [Terrimicrobiaceae bacterium]|jgi:hypothetical protein|nr:hypothetical protein [Terrimicrobiaceae bacterium]
MKNITITLPDDIGLKTRVLAAEADTSMSQFLCRLVTERIESETEYQAAMTRFLRRGARPLQAESKPYPNRDSLHDRHALR